MTRQIEEVVEYGFIIAADENGCLVTWNGSSIFNFWIYQGGIASVEGYINTAVKTVYGPDLWLAVKIAKEWLANPNDDEVCHSCRRPTDPDEWNATERLCIDCVASDKEGDE